MNRGVWRSCREDSHVSIVRNDESHANLKSPIGIGRHVLFFLMSVWGSFAFAYKFPLPEQMGELSWDQRLYYAFRDEGLLLFCLVIVFFAMWRYLEKNAVVSPGKNKVALCIAMLFSVMVLVGKAFSVQETGVGSYGDIDVMIGDPVGIALSLLVFFGLWIGFYGAIVCLFGFVTNRFATGHADRQTNLPEGRLVRNARRYLSNGRAWHFAILFLICWIPYIVVYFPGCIYHDSADQLAQFFGDQPLSAHHPLLTTYLFGGLVSIGKALGSDTLGVFLCTLFQAVFLSYACGRVVCACRAAGKTRGRTFALIAIALFVLVPLWGSLATSIKKDSVFCGSFVLLVVCLFECFVLKPEDERGAHSARHLVKSFIPITFWALIVSLARNDGFIFVIFALVCFGLYAFAMRFADRRKLLLSILCSCAVVALVYFCGYRMVALPLSGATPGSSVEALTIPIQQIARYYIDAPEDVSDQMDEGVSHVIRTEGLNAGVYNPLSSDNIKFNYAQEDISLDDLKEFFSAYFQMGMEHPVVFFEAFVDQTSGWWYPGLLGKPDWTVGNMGLYQNTPKVENYENVIDIDLPVYYSSFGQTFKQLIGAFGYIPGIGLLVYPAIYLWILILLVGVLWISDRKKDIIPLMPLFLYFLICIASPVNGLTRYAIPIITCIPLIAAWVCAYRRKAI